MEEFDDDFYDDDDSLPCGCCPCCGCSCNDDYYEDYEE